MAPRLSARAIAMPPSPIRKLVPLADEAKKRGIHVYHLNIGQPDIETPRVMLDALRNFPKRIVHYSHSQGEADYLRSLVEYYRSNRIYVDQAQIMVTTGGSEAIIFAFMAALDPGDEVIIPEPFYTNYNGFALMAGVTIKPLTTRVETGFHLPPADVIEATISKRTRAILLCNPNNPTGTVFTREEFDTVSELCRKHDLWLLTDEVYREFVYECGESISALNLEGMEDRVIMMDSISKRYSACGARIGAIVSRNREVMDACLRLGQARLCSPLVDQVMATAARDLPADYMDQTVQEYRRRREVVFEGLSQIPGVLATKPCGAFYNICRLPIDDAEHFSRWLLTDFSVDGQTVMLAPAAGFYATPGLGRDEVRLAYVLCVDDLKRAMLLLKLALDRYLGEQGIKRR